MEREREKERVREGNRERVSVSMDKKGKGGGRILPFSLSAAFYPVTKTRLFRKQLIAGGNGNVAGCRYGGDGARRLHRARYRNI